MFGDNKIYATIGYILAAFAQENSSSQGKKKMNVTRIIAIVLIIGGALGLIYGGFGYTRDTTPVKVGPVELSVTKHETVNVPIWVGVGAIVIGGLLLGFGSKRT